ncbi:MAG: hypothetical protein R2838_24560 [Caldilineaceae bacterium]
MVNSTSNANSQTGFGLNSRKKGGGNPREHVGESALRYGAVGGKEDPEQREEEAPGADAGHECHGLGKAAAAAQHGNLCAQLQRQETGGKRQTDDHSNLHVDHTGFSFVHCGVNTPAEMLESNSRRDLPG